MKNIESKRNEEKNLVKKMILFYCKNNRHSKDTPCKDCDELIEYAAMRIDKCPFMETKTFCSNCRIHCFKPDMRNRIKEVMRYSGKRMLFKEPILVIKHLYYTIKEKKNLKEKDERGQRIS